MKFVPEDIDVRRLLNSYPRFVIPPFQRDYSWDKNFYKKFIDDLITNIKNDSSVLNIDDYFIGTMVFTGQLTDNTLDVVDGQQRLTVITILLSAISQKFKEISEDSLVGATFNYIKSKDDYGESITRLTSASSFPYFDAYVQSLDKSHAPEVSNEEEETIKKTYDFFSDYLVEENLRKSFNIFNDIAYKDILIAIRDQILKSKLIAITTDEKESAYMIFEILNAKGKSLESIDLVKNIIFESFHNNENSMRDTAEKYWEEMKVALRDRKNGIGLATFYRHFWISKYKKVTNVKLYDSFKTEFKPKTSENYLAFIKELRDEAKSYSKIISPRLEDYSNRQEYIPLVQSLSEISQTFGNVQSRIVFLALLDVKSRNLIKLEQLIKAIKFVESFIFTYSILLKKQANMFESNFSKLAISLRKCKTKEEVHDVLENQLYTNFRKKVPKYDEFESAFLNLEYSAKRNISTNLATRYIIKRINQTKEDIPIFEQGMTIEHIMGEDLDKGYTLNIGNLILLTKKLNNEAGDSEYLIKRDTYKKAKNILVEELLEKYPDTFDKETIKERAKELSEYCYNNIISVDLGL
ncbi:TPA: DUF262 domain-containing protein [Streptococcus suis]